MKAFSSRRILAALALVFAAPAAAQYVATPMGGVPYPALSSSTPVSLVAITGTANDRGRATIPIGFSFPFYDRAYTQLTVTANGMAFLEPSSAGNLGADFSSNVAMPNVGEPNAVLAPMWDDLNGRNPGSTVSYQAVTGPNGQGLAVEWFDWNWFLAVQHTLTFQLRIWENGIVEFYYGTVSGNATPAMTATVGIESPTGTLATPGLPCGATCGLPDFVTNSLVTFGPAPGPDISITSLKINSIATVGPNLNISTSLAMRNFGTQAANNFTYRLYLSTDTVFNPGFDTELSPTPQGPLSIPALGYLTSTVSTTAPRPTSGSYYVIAVVDDGSVVAESNELNNLAATSVPLTAGVDLVAQNIVGPPLGGPGETITTTVTFSNQGFDVAGNVPVKIWLSADNLLSVNDLLVQTTTVPVSGGQNVVQGLTFALPLNIPAGEYFFILQIDDGPGPGVVVESSDSNNVKVGSLKFTARQADLVIDAVRVLEPLAPFGPARYAFFDEPIRLEAVVRNQGGATAPSVSILFYLSDNETLNGITDPFIGQQPGLTIAPGQTMTVNLTQKVPKNAVNGLAHRPGSFFFFAAAVAQGLIEVSSQNNFLKSEPQLVKLPAPDLIPVTVRGPAQGGSGEALLVTRTFTNVGNRPAGAAGYRYYLSANAIITESDLLLPMRNADGTTVDERSVTLTVGQQNVGSDVIVIPKGTPASSWFLGVLIDPPGTGTGAIAEVDEDNNGLAAQTIEVVSASLGLATHVLPTALEGFSYRAQLNGIGGEGGYTFALAPGDTTPPGLTLSADGNLTGTPTKPGGFSFGVVITSGARNSVEAVAIAVGPLTSSLAITSTRAPPIARLIPYELPLGAQGGRAPYTWSLAGGTLPQGIQVTADGRLAGTTQAALGTNFTFTLQALDAVGNIDRRELTVSVVDASALLISTAELPEGKVGSQYVVDIVAKNAGGAPISRPMKWSVVAGALPDGVALEPTTEDKLLISGIPGRSGVFAFTLEVEDARGRSDTADFVIRIVSPALTISAVVQGEALRGESISSQLTVLPALTGTAWSIRDGVLPPGVTFDAAGLLQGKIPDDARYGAYTFTVAVGGRDGATAMRSFSIEVVAEKTVAPRGCGCADVPGSLFALLALAGLAIRRSSSRGR